jgi:hypothetical protein
MDAAVCERETHSASRENPMSTIVDTDTALGRRAVDELLERYVSWREECNRVAHSYEGWIGSDRGEGALAYAAYLAALDREEHAARSYAHHLEHVRRLSP